MVYILLRFLDRHLGIPICYLLALLGFKKKKKEMEAIGNPKKILLIKILGTGNLVIALPSIRAIRKRFPKSKITLLTGTASKTIIEKEPSLDSFIFLDWEESVLKAIVSVIKLFFKVRKEKFDLVIDFEQFLRFSSIVAVLSGAKRRIGFDTKNQGKTFLYTKKVKYNNNQHTSKTFGDIAKAVDAKVNYKNRRIFLTSNELDIANKFISKNKANKKILIGMHPGCGGNVQGRRWPQKKFAKLADRLIDEYSAIVFFTGSKKESALVNSILKKMENSAIDTTGNYDLFKLTAIISKCNLFVSNDTCPLHIAIAMNIPTVAFFGPNTPKLYGPLGKNHLVFYKNLKCSPCMTNFNEKRTYCKHFRCIREIPVEEVFNRIKDSKILKE